MFTPRTLSTYRSHLFILGGGWMVLQAVFCFQYGIVTGYEAEKYINEADYFLQHGHYTSGNFVFYSTEILLIAAGKKMGTGYWPVVAIQMLFNAASVICFYRIVQKFTGRRKIAFVFTSAFLGMIYYQLYTVYLFTESLYFSFSILFLYLLLSISKLTPAAILRLAAGLAVLYFTRPVGLFFVPATFFYIVLKFYSKKALLVFCTTGTVFLILFWLVLNRSLNAGGEFDFLLPYSGGHVICGVPTVAVPYPINRPPEKNSIQGLFYIITRNRDLFLSLSAKRLTAFFGVVRSYYSWPHNLFIAGYFYSLYLMFLAGIRKWTRAQAPRLSFMLVLIFFTALTTALTCDEWHNRFIFTILPFLLLLASIAFAKRPPETSG